MKHLSVIFVISVFLTSFLFAQEQESEEMNLSENSWGIGLGIPYGVLGGNIDINVAPNFNLSAGIGTSIVAGLGYNIGLKYFFSSIKQSFRPRVSAYYGINSAVLKKYPGGIKEDEGEAFTGVSLGVGAQWMWGESKTSGLDFDIIYLASTGLDIDKLKDEGFDVDEPGKIKISIGYRHTF